MLKALVLLTLVATGAARGVETTESLPFQFSGSFSTRYGQTLDAKNPQGAISFEPYLALPFDGSRRVEMTTVIDRPTDAYRNFEVPRIALIYWQEMKSVSPWGVALQGSLNALNVERWKLDGHQLRASVAGEIQREVAKGLTLFLKAGPYAQWNHYRQAASGATFPWVGLQERLRLLWEYRDLEVDFRLLVAQSRSSIWKNDYATYEAVMYRLLPGVKVGVSHELESSVIDEITGRARGLDVFDSRVSRISALMELEL